jgi:predicted nucleic acid-binding protein
VDTGLFYALQGEETARHDVATTCFETILDGTYGRLVTSDYVLDETATLVRSRSGDVRQAFAVLDRALGRGQFPDAIDVEFVDRTRFEGALEVFETYSDQSLSFTDATTVHLVERSDIDRVLSFDSDFDGIVDRLDPADV